jgi:hypothetical protein
MKNLCTFLVLAIIGVAVLGYWRDWFHVSTDSINDELTFHVTVDKQKVKEDKEKAQQKLEEGGALLQEEAKHIAGKD